jgi:hypothetical protein
LPLAGESWRDPPTQAEMQTLADRLDQLLSALRR